MSLLCEVGLVDVPVLRPFTHEGRALAVGEILHVSPIVAAALHRRGLVSLTRQYAAKVMTPKSEPDPVPQPRRRRYRRRDLSAESE